MISNTSSSGLQIVDKVDLPYVELQPKIEFITSYGNNNNNDMSTNNKMSSFERMKPFTYYTSGAGVKGTADCAAIVIQQCSGAETVNNSNSLVNNKLIANSIGSNQCVTYEPCSLYNSKQEEITKKIIDNFRSDNSRSAIGSGGGIVNFTSMKNKTTSDTSSSCSNSNSSNSSSRSSKSDRQKSPMCRTEDQENAFRQIKVVHNYSKSNRYEYCNGDDSHVANMYSSNSSNQDEDEDDEEDDDEEELEDEVDYEHHLNEKVRTLIAIERQKNKAKHSNELQLDPKTPKEKLPIVLKIEEENKSLPDHHARRPMNAFLIFCKRHRGIVKEKYKNFENRSITKILGEWWASLDQNDKTPYVNLAKQNKDAFFSANPNFKWYKLPAPSLRTLNTRPGNTERPISNSNEYQYELNDSQIQDQLSFSQRSRLEPKRVEYFKLADETQMGELNNLIRPLGMPSNSDALQDALGETSDYFKTVCKRKFNHTAEVVVKVKRPNNDNGFSSSEEDVLPKKSSRSCKGKKYQELMNSGQITPVTLKKQLASKLCAIGNSSEENQEFIEYNDRSKTHPITNGELPPMEQNEQLKEIKQYDYSNCCGSPVKQRFGYVSFDLEDKIKALPAQCLETYLQRKKNTKRKKKINSKKRNSLPKNSVPVKGAMQSQLQQVKTAQEAREQMVGSQKRKARKESITRRDINSIQNEVQLILCTGSNDSNIVVSGVNAVSETLPAVNQSCTSDLLILAEVAANHTGIAKI